MNQRDKLALIKCELGRIYGSKCQMCGARKSKSGFTFHHIWYEKEEKTYKEFRNSLEYYEYLAPLVRKNNARFMYLCSDHHQALERACRYGDKLWRKLCVLRSRTLRSRRAN